SITCPPSVPAITHTSTSGGSSETEVNEFAVIPYPCSPTRDVITVTPVANEPAACRSSWPLNSVRPTTCWLSIVVAIGSDAAVLHSILDHAVEVLCCSERPGNELLERVLLQREQRYVGLGACRRLARRVAKDRDLAEELAVAERLELDLAPVR